MRLAVELYGTIVGTLEGAARSFDFTPSAAGIDAFGVNSTILSVAIPFVPAQPRHHARRRRNWFTELLPEGDQYDYLLSQGGLRRGDTPGFLTRYGRDVAGALQVWDRDDPTEPRTPKLRALSDADVRQLLEDPIGSPLANAAARGRSSLGGVQPKILVAKTPTGWAQAFDGCPTTHILKPRLASPRETVIFDEEYGSRLARAIGLANFETRIMEFAGLPTLVIERYDRVDGQRVHQEDFSQALEASGNEKYQEFGGVVSLKRIAELLTAHAPAGELRTLARMVVFAVAIGNLDLHSKNLGLLHPKHGDLRLAPTYDAVPQAHGSNDGKLALSVNGKYRFDQIARDDLHSEFTSWGMRKARTVIMETLDALKQAVGVEEPLDGAFATLDDHIAVFIDNLLDGRPPTGRT
ncbi:MAG: HipA domain-containing protein [Micrococcales bacterium]|nr:HipA domain-containing protein [Micrococcales bacterium]